MIQRHLMKLRAVLLAALAAVCAASGRQEIVRADGETLFVQSLVDRGMFDLAEQFCERQIARIQTADERADWELVLSDCYRQHAWNLVQANRNSLVQHAIERITDFLQNQTVSAPQELTLRMRQIELLTLPARMQFLADGGHPAWRQATRSSSGTADRQNEIANDPQPAEPEHETELKQAGEMAAGLLKQLDQLRRDLDPQDVRLIRDRTRFALAESQVGLSRMARTQAEADEQSRLADQSLQQLIRSANDDVLKFRARVLAAEIQLDRGDLKAVELRIDAVSAESRSPEQTEIVRVLRIRRVLQAGLPTDALQQLVDARSSGTVLSPELIALKMQAMLAMYELVWRLGDPEAVQTTADEFDRQQDEALQRVPTGVWHEAIQKVIRRKASVAIAGPVVADQLEIVEVHLANGGVEAARDEVLRILASIPENSAQGPKAQLALQAGDLSVKIGDWTRAAELLKRSANQFLELDDKSRAAAADLLAAYAKGRLWDNMPGRDQQATEYQNALTEHIRAYDDLPTATTAREWLIRLVQESNPARAIEELLTLAERIPESPDRAKWLTQAGTLLIREVRKDIRPGKTDSSLEAGSAAGADQQLRRYQDLNIEIKIASAELQIQSVELRLLSPESENNWLALRKELESIGVAAADTQLATRLALLRLVIDSRSTLNAAAVESHTAVLLRGSPEQRLDNAEFIAGYLNLGAPQPGDLLLARAITRLIEGQIANGTNERLRLLSLALPAATLTGNTALTDSLFGELLKAELTDQQIQRMAELITESSGGSQDNSGAGAAAGIPSVPDVATSDRRQRFWQSVLKRTPQGSDQWLEASLQTAILAESAGDILQGRKIMDVVEVLYPQWGNAERRQRAVKLRRQLQGEIR